MDNNVSSMKSLVAYEKIRDMILTGVKLPGTRLVLSDLETELGIGRGPIREALMRLDRSGLVKNIPYKGAVVASPPSRKEISIIFDIRVDLESQLAVEAMHNITPDKIAVLEELHGRMASVDADFYALDREFHKTIYEASNLPHLCSIVYKLIESVETFLNLYRQEITDCHKFSFEHGQILAAIKSKDEAQVRAVLQNNIRSGLEVVERSFSRLIRKPV
ncbi:GntR family transcriptional regulator [Desulfoluna spongiiphila]|uniref:DNA-binding transcriptional regulator, GntR family n=1 Tax=Desulfoluna spongiiphila TaxID=419481 RepID=A0A1G5H4C7_9BACT|nr:GntR family transcriptional regulator [Desulfoluna spongiiphila]SCY58564.1 DNA-binding transcriptional regulator, GntR family [Desulfoluna spongiiphila]VVS94794.1 transcription regulator hth gntr [Desulfoluna spongiiphila]